MSWTPSQTVSITITPFFLYLWWCQKGKSLCCLCKSQVSQSQGWAAPGCRQNPQELCWAVEWQNWANGLGVQSSSSEGLPARSRRWTLEWDCNYSWSKIDCRHRFCSMKYLQETSTDSLTGLKINWTVFVVFWNAMRILQISLSHEWFVLFCFFFHLSFTGFFHNPLAVSSSPTTSTNFLLFSKPSCLPERMQF